MRLSSSSATSSSPSAPSPSPSSAPSSHYWLVLLLTRADSVKIYKEGVKGDALWEDEVADIVATYTECIHCYGLFSLQGHFDRLEVCVH